MSNWAVDVYDSLPDLLKIAWDSRKHVGEDVYAIQDALSEEYRQREDAFRWSMPYRHLFQCSKCGCMETAVYHELENPNIKEQGSPLYLATLWESEVHEVRAHGGNFSKECQSFLSHLSNEKAWII